MRFMVNFVGFIYKNKEASLLLFLFYFVMVKENLVKNEMGSK